jgi:5'-nucleotidase
MKEILVCNDDGVHAPGIQALIEAMRGLGRVTVVAPDSPQSGSGHAITLNSTLRINKIREEENLVVYSTTGTPVDCVKLAVNEILHRKPDLLVSGINHGSNASINVLYSGTMSAAMEGALEGIPSIGFSLLNHSIDASFEASQEVVARIAPHILDKGLPWGVCLNVNIPYLNYDEIRGIKVCHQANGNWIEEFDARTDPGGQKYYWLTGKYELFDEDDGNDIKSLRNGYVTIVPVQCDLTAYKALDDLNAIDF